MNNLEMERVWVLEGIIDNGMEGITFTGGIFTSLLLARTAALFLIGKNRFREDNLIFSVETPKIQYVLQIKELVLNKVEDLKDKLA